MRTVMSGYYFTKTGWFAIRYPDGSWELYNDIKHSWYPAMWPRDHDFAVENREYKFLGEL